MQALMTILFAVQVLSALAMMGLILIQHGKGADMGAAFGSGSSGSLFGASGSANFLSRMTAVLATVFFACTLGLAFTSDVRPAGAGSVLEKTAAPAGSSPPAAATQAIPTAPSSTPSAPAAPASAGAQSVPTPSK